MTVLCIGASDGAMARVEVFTGPERRRRWSDEQKRAIVTASFAPGAVVSEVAPRATFLQPDVSLASGTSRRDRRVRPGVLIACRERRGERREWLDVLPRAGDRGRVWREGSGADIGLDPSGIGIGGRQGVKALSRR
jgi:Transposase